MLNDESDIEKDQNQLLKPEGAAQIHRNRSSMSLSDDLKDMYEQTAKLNSKDTELNNYFSTLISCDNNRVESISISSSNSSELLNRILINQNE